ncbi:MAG: RbsD/FucU domain-containing protein [Gemmataceae bacterium]
MLEAILSAVPVESVRTMKPEESGPYAIPHDPPVWDDYRRVIHQANLHLELEPVEKWAFYDAVMSEDHVLTVQTADQHRYANVLVTVGVRMEVTSP